MWLRDLPLYDSAPPNKVPNAQPCGVHRSVFVFFMPVGELPFPQLQWELWRCGLASSLLTCVLDGAYKLSVHLFSWPLLLGYSY